MSDESAPPALAGPEDALARIAALAAENAALVRRVAELEARIATRPAADDDVLRMLAAMVDRSPSLVFVKDGEGRYLLINRRYEEDCHTTREFLCGKTDHAWMPAEAADALRAQDRRIIEGGVPVQYEEVIPVGDTSRDYFTIKFPLFADSGDLLGLCCIATDITDRKRAEREREAMQDQLLAVQGQALQELSTPLMPIADGVLAMPIVGRIDPDRAARILETLLEGISRHAARTVILDFTGVRSVDARVARALDDLSRAAGLLGARVILSGVRPDVATLFVELGLDPGRMTVAQTLQTAIAAALGRRS